MTSVTKEKKEQHETQNQKQRTQDDESVIGMLQKAYSMEMETVANYLSDSVNLDGVLAEEIKKSLDEDITEELGHAKRLAERIKQLGGYTPGPTELDITHSHFQPDTETTDVEHIVRCVIEDEEAAIEHYKKIIRATDGQDYVTQDLCVQLQADEEKHLTLFRGYLKEFTKR
jgi:bacterioferritin